MKKVVLFSRVSTQTQNLDSQTNELIKEATNLGYSKEQQIPIEYKESAISLSMDERKGIQELKEKIDSDINIDCVIVFEISRLSRQTTMLFELRDWLISKHIQLICLRPYFRLLEDGKLSQTASIVFSLMTSLSESEMIIKKERMTRGRHFKREQGRYIGGRILLGYKVGNDDKIEVDYDDAETVRKIYRWYSEGKSMIWIARELEARGLVSGRWNGINSIICCIKEVLRREEYTGKKCHTYHYPRIISDEMFQEVAKLITKNKAKYVTNKRYLGQGLLREKKTGLLMTPNARFYRTYRIEMRSELTIGTKHLEELLWNICEKRAKTITKEKLEKIYLHDQQVLNNKIHTVLVEIENLKSKIDKINERIVLGKMNETKGDMMIKDSEVEIMKLQELHNKLTDKLLSLKPTEIDLSDRKSIVNNEIEVIWASNVGFEGTTRIKKLEINFKDGTTETYLYKSKGNKCWIELFK